MLFGIAAYIRCPVTVVEAMSHRQIAGWVEVLTEANEPEQESDAIDYSMLSKADKRAAFK